MASNEADPDMKKDGLKEKILAFFSCFNCCRKHPQVEEHVESPPVPEVSVTKKTNPADISLTVHCVFKLESTSSNNDYVYACFILNCRTWTVH